MWHVIAYVGVPGRSKRIEKDYRSEAAAKRAAKNIVETGPAWMAIVKES